MLHSKVVSMPISTKTLDIKNPIKSTFNVPIPPIGGSMASAISTMIQVRTLSYNTVVGEYPNQRFSSAVDVNTIERAIMSMDPNNCSETEDVLSDPATMEALQCADRQYREGKAIPLEDLMREMGFDEDEL